MCRKKTSPDGPIREISSKSGGSQPLNLFEVDSQTATYLGSVHHKVRKSSIDPTLVVGSAHNQTTAAPTIKYFEMCLLSKPIVKVLDEFLDNEFCSETLQFIKKVDEYQLQLHEMNLQDEIQRRDLSCFREEIIKEFLMSSSENEVILLIGQCAGKDESRLF